MVRAAETARKRQEAAAYRGRSPISSCASFPRAAQSWVEQPCVGVLEDFRLNRRWSCDAQTADKAAIWLMEELGKLGRTRHLQARTMRVCPVGADAFFRAITEPDGTISWRWELVG